MKIYAIDFETFYTDERDPNTGLKYELSSMTTESYVRHPWFKAHGAAVRFPLTGQIVWFTEPELQDLLRDTNWAETALVAHHAQFDGLILSHHYNVRPCFWFCTLSMARLMLGNHIGVGLEALCKLFGLPPKTVPYNLFKGYRWEQLRPEVQELVGKGACDDVDRMWTIFQKLLTGDY